jgi:hypothetical protein
MEGSIAKFMQLHLADHRSWEDWLFVILGAPIILAPAIAINQAGPGQRPGGGRGHSDDDSVRSDKPDAARGNHSVPGRHLADGFGLFHRLCGVDKLRMLQFELGAVVAVHAAFKF